MKKALIIIVMTFVYIVGCQMLTHKDTQEIKDTIMRYNKILARGYAQMNMTPLRDVATLEHSTKVYHHMAALGESGIRMESQLVDIKFLEIQFPRKDFAMVKTREQWNYSHVKIRTKMPGMNVVRGLIYKLSYELVLRDEKWLVSSVSLLDGNMSERFSQTAISNPAIN